MVYKKFEERYRTFGCYQAVVMLGIVFVIGDILLISSEFVTYNINNTIYFSAVGKNYAVNSSQDKQTKNSKFGDQKNRSVAETSQRSDLKTPKKSKERGRKFHRAYLLHMHVYSAIWTKRDNISQPNTASGSSRVLNVKPYANNTSATDMEPTTNNFNNIALIGWMDTAIFQRPFTYKCCFLKKNKGGKWHISQEADLPRWKTRIRAARLNCLTDLNPSTVKGITVTHPNTSCPVQKNQYINVEKPLNNPKTHTQLAICSKIAFHELNASHLLEWIEVHRLLGADLIVSYTYNLNEKALAVLKYYEKIGLVKLLNFDLPEKELIKRTAGDKTSQGYADEQIPLFDCQNRLAGYKYYALLDTDEFLIPNTSDFKNAIKTYMDKQLKKLPKLAGFHFQTKIHALNWMESDSSSPLMIKRFSNSTPAFADRVKKLYFPNRVIVDRMLTHSLHAKPGFVKKFANPMDIVVHHFRACRKEWLNGKQMKWKRLLDNNINATSVCFDFKQHADTIIIDLANTVENSIQRQKKILGL